MRTALILMASIALAAPVAAQTQTMPRNPPPSVTQGISEVEQQALAELFDAMDMAALGARFATDFLGQVEYLLGSVGNGNRTLAMQIVEEETMAVVQENQMSLMMKLYPVYAKHFDEEELAELTAFYQTPTGQKAVMLMPQLMSETMSAGQSWGMSIAPVIVQRVMNRMSESRSNSRPAEPAAPPPNP